MKLMTEVIEAPQMGKGGRLYAIRDGRAYAADFNLEGRYIQHPEEEVTPLANSDMIVALVLATLALAGEANTPSEGIGAGHEWVVLWFGWSGQLFAQAGWREKKTGFLTKLWEIDDALIGLFLAIDDRDSEA